MNALRPDNKTTQQAVGYLHAIAAGLLPNPDLLEIRPEGGSHESIYLTLILPPSERGYLIGRHGKLYESLCNLMRSYSGLRKQRFLPRIFDGSTKETYANETAPQLSNA